MKKFSRRKFIKAGVWGGGYLVLGPSPRWVQADDFPPSPPLTPFVADLPLPPPPRPVAPFASPDCEEFIGAGTRFFQIVAEERLVRFHPQLPRTLIWGYRDINVASSRFALGPTFMVRMATACGQGVVVRHFNRLRADHVGFGDPRLTVHLHGAHTESRSDGFPTALYAPGEAFDYCYPHLDTGFSHRQPDPGERPSTLWYHDHAENFTGPNIYRGLAGFHLVFDALDTGRETTGLRLPSGRFDVPLALQDKRFAADGSLLFDPFDFDGFLGDTFVVNGAVQPRFRVKRRKYRFRLLDASNARFYELFLTKADGTTFPFDHIATEGGLLSRPIRGITSLRIIPSQRMEIVIDFSRFAQGDRVFLENRLEQDDGRGPDGLVARGTPLLQFIVEDAVADPSRVPDVLRPFAAITQAEIDRATRKTFEFERTNGAWAINDKFFDANRPLTTSPINTPEIWKLVNKSGGWDHPIHIHVDFHRVLRRNGALPPLNERDGIARKDATNLGPNDEVEIFIKFRDFPGRFVFHCHNSEHEDHAMMARFDVLGAGGPNSC